MDESGKVEPLVYDHYAKQFIEIKYSSVLKDYTGQNLIEEE